MFTGFNIVDFVTEDADLSSIMNLTDLAYLRPSITERTVSYWFEKNKYIGDTEKNILYYLGIL